MIKISFDISFATTARGIAKRNFAAHKNLNKIIQRVYLFIYGTIWIFWPILRTDYRSFWVEFWKKLGGVPLIRENTNNQSNLNTFTLEEP